MQVFKVHRLDQWGCSRFLRMCIFIDSYWFKMAKCVKYETWKHRRRFFLYIFFESVFCIGSVAKGMSRERILGAANTLYLGGLHIASRSERISAWFLRVFNWAFYNMKCLILLEIPGALRFYCLGLGWVTWHTSNHVSPFQPRLSYFTVKYIIHK